MSQPANRLRAARDARAARAAREDRSSKSGVPKSAASRSRHGALVLVLLALALAAPAHASTRLAWRWDRFDVVDFSGSIQLDLARFDTSRERWATLIMVSIPDPPALDTDAGANLLIHSGVRLPTYSGSLVGGSLVIASPSASLQIVQTDALPTIHGVVAGAPIPEPSAALLFGAGALGLSRTLRRRSFPLLATPGSARELRPQARTSLR